MTSTEFKELNDIVSKEIKQGHSFRMIVRNHKAEFSVGERTLYNYVENGYLDIINLDLPRKVRYKKRKHSNTNTPKKDTKIRINRTFEDFKDYIKNYNDNDYSINIVEMDTVEGLKDENDCFLTLLWRKSKFMLIFKLENQTTEEVSRIFNILQQLIPYDDYKRLFQVILTDNGHEFFDVLNIECMHSTGEQVTKLFFCDPHMSCQKGMIEKNHEFIRYILPKGSSFKNITQEDCDLFMNNINSLCRDSLNGKSPYEAMLFLCDEYVLKSLNCYYIKPDEVILNDSLLKY